MEVEPGPSLGKPRQVPPSRVPGDRFYQMGTEVEESSLGAELSAVAYGWKSSLQNTMTLGLMQWMIRCGGRGSCLNRFGE